jgi:hypothetical protein
LTTDVIPTSSFPKDINYCYCCRKCNKKLGSRQSRHKHEKICTINNEIILIKKNYEELKNDISKLKNDTIKINNNINSNNITDNSKKIIINFSPGTEPINHLTIDQQKGIMDKGLNSLLDIIRLTNFDKDKPEFHSYCVTAINDKHASILDKDTQTIVKTEKQELFDTLLNHNISKLESISKNKLLSYSDREEFSDKIVRLKKILFENKKGINKYYSQINLLSFNNKEEILKTWDNIKKSLDTIINEENLSIFNDINNLDEESDEEINKIIHKNKTYILENNKLYKINLDNSKGELYGEYTNGKVKKFN